MPILQYLEERIIRSEITPKPKEFDISPRVIGTQIANTSSDLLTPANTDSVIIHFTGRVQTRLEPDIVLLGLEYLQIAAIRADSKPMSKDFLYHMFKNAYENMQKSIILNTKGTYLEGQILKNNNELLEKWTDNIFDIYPL